MTLRAAIVDDELLARSRLRRLLGNVAGADVQVVMECVDVEELLAMVPRCPIDVLFLDIAMPGADGFSALARWNGPLPMVVFVTAFAEHGVRAFDARAVDYLLKPVAAERLRQSVGRLLEGRDRKGRPEVTDAGGQRIVALTVGARTHMVPESQINLIESDGNYLEVHTTNGHYAMRRTLSSIETELSGSGAFIRVHRSILVRTESIREIVSVGSGRYRIELRSGQQVFSGRNFRSQVQGLMGRGAASDSGD